MRIKVKPYKTNDYQENVGKFPIRNPIETRPIEANNLMRLGDWEIDNVLSKQDGRCLLTVVCHKSRFSIEVGLQKLLSDDFVIYFYLHHL